MNCGGGKMGGHDKEERARRKGDWDRCRDGRKTVGWPMERNLGTKMQYKG